MQVTDNTYIVDPYSHVLTEILLHKWLVRTLRRFMARKVLLASFRGCLEGIKGSLAQWYQSYSSIFSAPCSPRKIICCSSSLSSFSCCWISIWEKISILFMDYNSDPTYPLVQADTLNFWSIRVANGFCLILLCSTNSSTTPLR